ncbi:hypothetical protein M8J77_023767 [Diaphorina citri]|nr:hypothetical protein M8J77_023767 [Diaphorina citri]
MRGIHDMVYRSGEIIHDLELYRRVYGTQSVTECAGSLEYDVRNERDKYYLMSESIESYGDKVDPCGTPFQESKPSEPIHKLSTRELERVHDIGSYETTSKGEWTRTSGFEPCLTIRDHRRDESPTRNVREILTRKQDPSDEKPYVSITELFGSQKPPYLRVSEHITSPTGGNGPHKGTVPYLEGRTGGNVPCGDTLPYLDQDCGDTLPYLPGIDQEPDHIVTYQRLLESNPIHDSVPDTSTMYPCLSERFDLAHILPYYSIPEAFKTENIETSHEPHFGTTVDHGPCHIKREFENVPDMAYDTIDLSRDTASLNSKGHSRGIDISHDTSLKHRQDSRGNISYLDHVVPHRSEAYQDMVVPHEEDTFHEGMLLGAANKYQDDQGKPQERLASDHARFLQEVILGPADWARDMPEKWIASGVTQEELTKANLAKGNVSESDRQGKSWTHGASKDGLDGSGHIRQQYGMCSGQYEITGETKGSGQQHEMPGGQYEHISETHRQQYENISATHKQQYEISTTHKQQYETPNGHYDKAKSHAPITHSDISTSDPDNSKNSYVLRKHYERFPNLPDLGREYSCFSDYKPNYDLTESRDRLDQLRAKLINKSFDEINVKLEEDADILTVEMNEIEGNMGVGSVDVAVGSVDVAVGSMDVAVGNMDVAVGSVEVIVLTPEEMRLLEACQWRGYTGGRSLSVDDNVIGGARGDHLAIPRECKTSRDHMTTPCDSKTSRDYMTTPRDITTSRDHMTTPREHISKSRDYTTTLGHKAKSHDITATRRGKNRANSCDQLLLGRANIPSVNKVDLLVSHFTMARNYVVTSEPVQIPVQARSQTFSESLNTMLCKQTKSVSFALEIENIDSPKRSALETGKKKSGSKKTKSCCID